MAAVFDFLSDDDSRRRAEAVASLTLDGSPMSAKVGQAIKDITYERTIEAASTVTLALIDPDGDLLDSGLFSSAVDLELPAPRNAVPPDTALPVPAATLGYRLVRIKTTTAILSLDFEDREVARLRGHRTLLKASRADMTRAEFIRMMVREVKGPSIRFWSPELHVTQPIKTIKDKPKPVTKRARRDMGFGSAEITVKGAAADNSQKIILDTGLSLAIQMKANKRVQIGLVEAFTQETTVENPIGTVVGITGGHLVNVGVLQQDSRYWPATRDVAKDARPFVKRLIEVEKANRGRTIGWCVDEVQRSYTHGGARQGKDYDQWQTEATKTVEVFTGEDPDAARIQEASTYRKSFIFRRGEPGGKRETTWAASGRLAADVNWRRFVDLGVFHYVSDDYLRKAAPRLTLKRTNLPAGVLSVNVGDFDTGKPMEMVDGRRRGGAEVMVDVLTDVLSPPIGGVWVLDGYGPCDGRYLIESVRGSYLTPRATVTLTLPVPKLPEPAPELGTKRKVTVPKLRDKIDVKVGSAWGGSLSIFTQIITPFMEQHGLHAGSTKRTPAQNAAAGGSSTSDHLTTSRNSYAIDYPTTNGERIAADLAASLGISTWKANDVTRYAVAFPGIKTSVQILWGAKIDHDDHIHVGIRVTGHIAPPPLPHGIGVGPGSSQSVLWHPDAVRVPMEDAGSFTGGGSKIVHHTTEGGSIAGAESAYRSKRAAPHFTFDHDADILHQHIPLNQAARALRHPSGPETNRGGHRVIQIEHVGFAATSHDWSDAAYARIAALCRWIESNIGGSPVRDATVSFGAGAPRLSGAAWVAYTGHIGHMHAPGNDHIDPSGNQRLRTLPDLEGARPMSRGPGA
jgi:hypothetical protein